MDNNDSCLGSKTVRMFYCLVLKHVIPHNMTIGRTEKRRGTLSDKEWEVDFCESVNSQLDALLNSQDFQISFDRKTGVRPCNKKQSTYFIPFLVSKVYEFKSGDIIIPKPGCTGFKVEASALSSAQKTLAQNIRDALGKKVAVHELVFSMATSRNFIFELYYEGSFKVKRAFSDADIKSECGIRNALGTFFEEIASAIEPFGFKVTSTPSRHRRSPTNEYLFGIYYTPHIGFGEGDVHGEGCYAIRGDASADEVNEYGIDFESTAVDDANALLRSTLEENLPPFADLISSEISYVDDSGEAFDICDDLI